MFYHIKKQSLVFFTGLFAILTFASTTYADVSATDKGGPSKSPKIAQILARPQLAGADVSITVRDENTGELLYDLNGKKKMNPASNMKLLTTFAALEVFSPGLQFRTQLEGDLNDGKISGPLIVRASGDVALHPGDLLALATKLKQIGVQEIDGGIVVVLGALGEGLPPAFEQKNEAAAYRAAVSAFSLSFNGLHVEVTPSKKVDASPVVVVTPFNHTIKVENQAKTVAGRGYPTVKLVESDKEIKVVVSGKSGQKSSSRSVNLRISAPTQFAAAQLVDALQQNGIKVQGGIKVVSQYEPKEVLATHDSISVAHDLYLMNKYSNNFIAESYFRRLGSLPKVYNAPILKDEGWQTYSEANADQVYREKLKSCLGEKLDDLVIKNGSGLYDGNLLTTDLVSQVLFCATKKPWFSAFKSSLPIGGEDGSLKNRFKGGLAGRIYAKTGTLNEVSALSGYVTSKSGRPLIVSVIFNKTPKFAWLLRPDQDAIIKEIVDAF